MAVLRRSLWPGLLSAARLNLSHQRQRLKLFELGPQFAAGRRRRHADDRGRGVAVGSRGPEHWDGAARQRSIIFDVKGDVEALLR